MTTFSRRAVSISLLSLPLVAGCRTTDQPVTGQWMTRLEAIEARRGGRIGVAAHDLETGARLGHRSDERFAMCSSFKWVLGGLVLMRVDAGQEDLSRQIAVTKGDMVAHAPTTGPAIGSTLSVETLCAATIANSDNPAANLLLETMGGPGGFTQALRAIGDETTRLDRNEPDLNANTKGDPRDTTTPLAMTQTMERMLFGDVLRPHSRQMLQSWMLAATTGAGRLTAGLPQGWRLGHKTGTNASDVNNDVGFALAPPNEIRKPILIVSFSDGPGSTQAHAEMAHADVARAVFGQFL